MGKKIFAIINKCEGVQINIGGLGKNQKLTSKGGFIWHTGVTEYNRRNIFLQKSCRKWDRETSSRSLSIFQKSFKWDKCKRSAA